MIKEKSATSSKKGILYLLFGGGIGAILALLFAPKTGKELRGELGDAANKGLNKAEAFAGKVGEKAGDIYQDTKTKAGEDKGKEIWADIQSEKKSFNVEENKPSVTEKEARKIAKYENKIDDLKEKMSKLHHAQTV